ncbi:MAG: cysteine desulfurase family protein [Candidatus Wallbacteria bacterium]|nr:cysteine desulfurase family protein [Candidatus Wallbacteria bacterium]
MKRIYLDYNATTPIDPRVWKAMQASVELYPANPSSIHTPGQEARIFTESCRETIAGALNSNPAEIVFTGSGSESDNLALLGVMRGCTASGRRHLIVSGIEHPAVEKTAKALEQEGFHVDRLAVDKHGFIDFPQLESLITPATVLVSVIHANNEIGTIQDLTRIAELCRKNGALLHTDAVQSFGKVPINVRQTGIDLLSASAHKIYGPKGCGFLFVRKGVQLSPVLFGGKHELGLRPGTESIHNLAGLAEASRIMELERESDNQRISSLKSRLVSGIAEIPEIIINSPEKNCLSGTLNVSIRHVEGESLLAELDLLGIAVSTGSACASGSSKPSPILTAIGLAPDYAQGSLRISLGRWTEAEEIDCFLSVLPGIVGRLRRMSALSGREDMNR